LTLPVKALKALVTAGLVEHIMSSIQRKDQTKLGKKAKKGTKSLSDLTKLDDAPKAGTAESIYCTLYLTEGDSAKTLAVAGASELDKNYVGIFPLKGKPMNVREHTLSAVLKNEEIIAICRILGLEPGIKYTELKQLRYGKVVMMADQDVDGFHIKGLALNIFHHMWPELLENSEEFGDFFNSFQTPVIKATKGKQVVIFYTVPDFDKWRKTAKSGWFIKYYKGLGTSTKVEAKEYFRDLKNLVKPIRSVPIDNLESINEADQIKMKIVVKAPKKKKKKKAENDEDEDEEHEGGEYTITKKYINPNTEAVTLAFEKSRANDRKGWVKDESTELLDYTAEFVSIPDFFNKEMRLYSKDDCERNIAGIDGFKPGGRKIVQTLKKKGLLNIRKQQKVGQIANLSSGEMDYHHGEKSLCEAVVKLAQDYCGANNVNILQPEGQFGSRIQNGADHASERYTFSFMNALGQILIRTDDDGVLEYNIDDDGRQIEAKLFGPILPMVLMNGANGIGTGFMTNIAKYNPMDVLQIYRAFLNGEDADYDIVPFYYGFKGSILKGNVEGTFLVYGKYQIVDTSTVRITELPVGSKTCKSFEKYKEFLSKMKADGKILNYVSKVDDTNCEFTVTMDEDILTDKRAKREVYKFFSLCASINTSNMYLWDVNGVLKYYNTINEIIDEYYYFRYDIYEKRKVWLIKKLKKELDVLAWRMKFIDDYISGVLEINNKKKADIIAQLEEAGFPKIISSKKESVDDDEEEDDNITKVKTVGNYNYLLSIKLYALTEEQIEILRGQLDEKTEDLRVAEVTTIEEQWLYELDEFEVEYTRVKLILDEVNAAPLKDEDDMLTKKTTKKTTKKKKLVKKKTA
jgi:DNA topoisomerase-2